MVTFGTLTRSDGFGFLAFRYWAGTGLGDGWKVDLERRVKMDPSVDAEGSTTTMRRGDAAQPLVSAPTRQINLPSTGANRSSHSRARKRPRKPVAPVNNLRHWPQMPLGGAQASTERFRAAVQEAKIGPDKDIPHVTPQVIVKYTTNLQLLGLL